MRVSTRLLALNSFNIHASILATTDFNCSIMILLKDMEEHFFVHVDRLLICSAVPSVHCHIKLFCPCNDFFREIHLHLLL